MRRLGVLAMRLAAVLAGLYGFQVLCVRPYRCGQAMARVEARSMQALRSADSNVVSLLARSNLARLDQVRAGCPEDITWHMLYAGNCRLLGRDEEAIAEYTAALALNQRPEIYMQRGLTKLSLGRTEAAIPDLIAAARFNPLVVESLAGETRRRVEAAIR